MYILHVVMYLFQVVYHRTFHKPFFRQVCLPTKYKRQVGYCMLHHKRVLHITILYHAIENIVGNTINVTYPWQTMGRLDEILSHIQALFCIGLAVFAMACALCVKFDIFLFISYLLLHCKYCITVHTKTKDNTKLYQK